MEQTLIPSFINVVYDGKELNIVDAQLSLDYDNGTHYEESMTSTGKKGYMLRKGTSVTPQGDISVTILKTADKKQDETITFLQQKLVTDDKVEDPTQYVKDIVITVQDAEGRQFLTFSFGGYIKDLRLEQPKRGNMFTTYIAEFQIFDPLSIKLSN